MAAGRGREAQGRQVGIARQGRVAGQGVGCRRQMLSTGRLVLLHQVVCPWEPQKCTLHMQRC